MIRMMVPVVVWMLCSVGSAQAQTLPETVAQALAYAPSMQAAEAARRASDEDFVLGRAWLRPYVVAKGAIYTRDQDYTYKRPNPILANKVMNHQRSYGVTLYQPLFDLEKWAGYQQGKLLRATGELKLALQRQQVMLQVAAAWLAVVRAQAGLAAAAQSEREMSRVAKQAQVAFDVGTVAVNDSLSASSRRDLAKARRIRAAQALAEARARLDSLAGHPVSMHVELPAHVQPLRAEPDQLAVWERRAASAAIDVQLHDDALEMADAGKLKALGGALPKVQVVAGWNRDNSSDGIYGGTQLTDASIGVEFSMPLYAGGGTWAQQRKSLHQKRQAEFALQEAKRSARLAAREAFLELQTTAAEVQALDAALASAKVERRAAAAGYAAGIRSVTETLDAEARLAIAKQRYADAVARHSMAYLRLLAAANQLTVERMRAVDRLFGAS